MFIKAGAKNVSHNLHKIKGSNDDGDVRYECVTD